LLYWKEKKGIREKGGKETKRIAKNQKERNYDWIKS
jgi:hypothetical protein